MPSTPTALADDLTLDRDGAQRHPSVLDTNTLQNLSRALAGVRSDQAGLRLFGVTALRPFLHIGGPIGNLAASGLGQTCRPVRAILFDKTPSANWALGWHQDRVIAVTERIEVDGFGPWSRKRGALHVAPPFDVLAGMVTLRLHLDDVPPTNAPLLIAPGSHRMGSIAEADVPSVVSRCGVVACLARAGDVWLYSTPILHASEAASGPGRRRVLQVDFAARPLPGGLEWLGV